jgi:hypothetical protein
MRWERASSSSASPTSKLAGVCNETCSGGLASSTIVRSTAAKTKLDQVLLFRVAPETQDRHRIREPRGFLFARQLSVPCAFSTRLLRSWATRPTPDPSGDFWFLALVAESAAADRRSPWVSTHPPRRSNHAKQFRRRATIEPTPRDRRRMSFALMTPAFNRRSATNHSGVIVIRGLKPTSTVKCRSATGGPPRMPRSSGRLNAALDRFDSP